MNGRSPSNSRTAPAGAEHAVVRGDGAAQAEPRAGEGDAILHAERQPKRVGLDAPARDDATVQLGRRQRARDLGRFEPDLCEEPAGGGVRAAEDVRAEIEPVAAAGLRADPPTDPVGGLEQHDVEVAQRPGRGEPGDPAPDHNRVVHDSRA